MECRKKLKSILMVASLVARNANEAVVGSGRVCVWCESGARWSVLCWCVLQEFGFSHREDIFTYNLLYKEIL
jgi:hypothetical protein